MSDLEYFKALNDYDEIKDYLDTDNSDYVPPELPAFVPDYSTSIIVDNIPSTTPDKVQKLTQAILKIYRQISPSLKESDVFMPLNEEAGVTYGFCAIMFNSSEEAETAIKTTQGFDGLSKKNPFRVSLYSDLDKYAAISDTYVSPEPPAFKPRPDSSAWLKDPQCRDQFVIRHSGETEISWMNTTGEEPTMVYAGEREKVGGKVWCESYVSWSPQGTYLATFHTPGVKLWGSVDFEAQGRFMHPGVEEMEFSPCESYMVSYRFNPNVRNANPEEAIIVWDVRNGTKLRAFPLNDPLDVGFQVQATVPDDKGGKKERVIRGRIESRSIEDRVVKFVVMEGNTRHELTRDKIEPLQDPDRLKWSADGKYLAKIGVDKIQVYELPSMTLLDKKSVAAKDVLDFAWSPRSNLISYWSPAVGNHPALVNVLRIPDRVDVCSRKLFDVSGCRMVWQNDGEYLCVYMTKIQGKKKTFVLMFFRITETGVPVEQLELSENVLSVTWEPSGDRVAIAHGEPRTPSISFYSMSGVSSKAATKGRKELSSLFTITGVQCNEVIWSPAGGIVALKYQAPDCCMFQLHDVDTNVSLASRRHDRGNRLVWDPSGRYIASCTITPLRAAAARGQPDDGFVVYTFQGNMLCQVRKERLFQFQWRPRPKNLLSPEEKKKVIKNLKKYEKLFDKEDRQRRQELQQEMLSTRRRTAEEFLARLSRNKAAVAALKRLRVAIRDGYDSDDDRNYDIDVHSEEVIISTREQVIQ
jgi:translation initiation factor 3 subunit B